MDTRTHIMDTAEMLMKRAGYSGFSYADIAREVQIRKASIHHHFPTKSDLAQAAVARYTRRLAEHLQKLDIDELGLEGAFKALQRIFLGALYGPGGACLCGSLAADWDALPDDLQKEVRTYWDQAIAWVSSVIAHHKPQWTQEACDERALEIFSLYEGALISARVMGNPKPVEHVALLAHKLLE